MVKNGVGRLLAVALGGMALVACTAASAPALAAASVSAALSKTSVASGQPAAPPPMGWSSWNSFADSVDATVVMQQAKALVASGMQKAGYRFINIDEGWWLGERDAEGNIVVDARQWPALQPGERAGDMANIVRYIHGLGLQAGIYTDIGRSGCGFYGPAIGPPRKNTGSEGHYEQDFLQFAKWGFDYVKVDWCGGNGENLDPAVQYAEVAHAIARAERATGHPLFFSICNWGKNSPWTWAPGVGGVTGAIWRTSGDIVAPIVANSPISTRKASFPKVLSNFDHGIHPEAQHTGFYNDPDMMVVGMQGLSEAQNRVHMSLWAISGAPLLVGADLSRLDGATLGTLTNPEAIAVDQDPLGLQAILVAQPSPGLQVWAKRLAHDGERAVLLLNRTAAPAQISATWSELGLVPSSSATVRDLWLHRDLGPYRSSYSAIVPAGDAVMLVLRGTAEKATRYDAAASANEFDGGAVAAPCRSCGGGKSVAIGNGKALTFQTAPMQGPAYVRIAYLNPSKVTRLARLRVNGQTATNVGFAPTGDSGAVGTVTVEVNLDQASASNRLKFFSRCSDGPALVSIAVSADHTALATPDGKGSH